MPLENRPRTHVIGREPDKKHRGEDRSANEFEEGQSGGGSGQEKNEKEDAEGDECVDMK